MLKVFVKVSARTTLFQRNNYRLKKINVLKNAKIRKNKNQLRIKGAKKSY